MSIDAFLKDLLPKIETLSNRFISGGDKDAQQDFDNELQIRARMATELTTSSNRGQRVANQTAYDAASVIERQMVVIGQPRIAYYEAAETQRQQTGKVYEDIRVQSSILKQQYPTTDINKDELEEPYLDASGNIVFDSDT